MQRAEGSDAVIVSGLFDLASITATYINNYIRLDDDGGLKPFRRDGVIVPFLLPSPRTRLVQITTGL